MAKKSKHAMQNTRPTEQAAMRNIAREAAKMGLSEEAVLAAYRFLHAAGMPATKGEVIRIAITREGR